MNRREFFKSLMAAAAIAAVPFQWAYSKVAHRLYGDGLHDETEALQALLDGQPVLMPDGRTVQQLGSPTRQPGPPYLQPGTYKVTKILTPGNRHEM